MEIKHDIVRETITARQNKIMKVWSKFLLTVKVMYKLTEKKEQQIKFDRIAPMLSIID